MALIIFYIFCVAFVIDIVFASLKVSLQNDGPVVLGANVTFTATVTGYENDGEVLEFVYWDNTQPSQNGDFYLATNVSKWTVSYPRSEYNTGEYTAHVELRRKNFFNFYYVVDTATTTFMITESLNGDLVLRQNNTVRPNSFVAVNQTVNHFVKLRENELQYLKGNSSSIITYWFIDCDFVDMTTDFSLNYTYADVMGSHSVDVLVVANHKPLPPLPTTTTTTTTTSTITTTTTTTTTPKPSTITTTKPPTTQKPENKTANLHSVQKRAISNKTIFKKGNSPLKGFVCDSSIIPMGEDYTYGHFKETLNIREPIRTPVNITGRNWLEHEDLMHLQVTYSGSPPFHYCAIYKSGQYNITGNETCASNVTTTTNTFPLVHYFSDSDQHTVVVIIENDVGKVVTRATINIYKASVDAQLSVIVVPVVFCLLAVILVVFGIAYYQHRSRYTVEVADFDFGQQSRLDYKTFTERLRDSFRNAFKFNHQDDTDPLTTNTRYDSMT